MNTNTEFPTYVFATVTPGRVQKVVEELRNNSQIDLIAPVTGRFDLALRVKSNVPNVVYETINQIRSLTDVQTTTSFTSFDGIQPNKQLVNPQAIGFSLLRVNHTPLAQSIKQLSSLPGFVEAFAVPGQFDIVALWQATSPQEIMKTSVQNLSSVGGLFRSETLLAYAPVFKQ